MAEMKEGGAYRLVLVTGPDEGTLAEVARTLVEEGLAACVNIVPRIRSVYRWGGGIQDEAESLLVAKTTAGRLEAFCARVVELHGYDVPEVISLVLDRGHPPYLDWVSECCSGGARGG